MQQEKSAIEKLLDQEHARREPGPFDGVANLGLRGMSTIDEGLSAMKKGLSRSIANWSIRSGSLLEKTGDLANEGLEAVAAAERYSNRKFRLTWRFWKKAVR